MTPTTLRTPPHSPCKTPENRTPVKTAVSPLIQKRVSSANKENVKVDFNVKTVAAKHFSNPLVPDLSAFSPYGSGKKPEHFCPPTPVRPNTKSRIAREKSVVKSPIDQAKELLEISALTIQGKHYLLGTQLGKQGLENLYTANYLVAYEVLGHPNLVIKFFRQERLNKLNNFAYENLWQEAALLYKQALTHGLPVATIQNIGSLLQDRVMLQEKVTPVDLNTLSNHQWLEIKKFIQLHDTHGLSVDIAAKNLGVNTAGNLVFFDFVGGEINLDLILRSYARGDQKLYEWLDPRTKTAQ